MRTIEQNEKVIEARSAAVKQVDRITKEAMEQAKRLCRDAISGTEVTFHFREAQRQIAEAETKALASIAAVEAELPPCDHEWSRRRDGRACHWCGKVEFGDLYEG